MPTPKLGNIKFKNQTFFKINQTYFSMSDAEKKRELSKMNSNTLNVFHSKIFSGNSKDKLKESKKNKDNKINSERGKKDYKKNLISVHKNKIIAPLFQISKLYPGIYKKQKSYNKQENKLKLETSYKFSEHLGTKESFPEINVFEKTIRKFDLKWKEFYLVFEEINDRRCDFQ